MTLLKSLPDRPLSAAELTALNRADAVDLAVSVEDDEPARSLLVATERWVKGLTYDDGGWTVVETVSLDDTKRIDGLQACEDAILEHRDDGDDAADE